MHASRLLVAASLVTTAACGGRTPLHERAGAGAEDALTGGSLGVLPSGGVTSGPHGGAQTVTNAQSDYGGARGSSAAIVGGTMGIGGTGGTVGNPMGGTIARGGAPAFGGSSRVATSSTSRGGTTVRPPHSGGSGTSATIASAGGVTSSRVSAGGTSLGGSSLVPNGGTATIGGAGGTSSGVCGNGIVEPGEQCDLGTRNQLSPAFWVRQSIWSFVAVPLNRTGAGADFYSYSSSSAHNGFEAVGTSCILLYLDRSKLTLALVVFHGIDQDSTGEEQPTSHVQMLFSGLPDTTFVELSDDSDELLMTSSTTATGFWRFEDNSDGGVLSGLPFPGDWSIKVEPTFIDGISTWAWIESDGLLMKIDPTLPITIESHSTRSQCRIDCTIPRCGDAILDGGEICDDGQASSSSCSSDCASYE